MHRLFIVILTVSVLSLWSCATLLPRTAKDYPPQRLALSLPLPPDTAYMRAYKAFTQMPGSTIRTADATMHYLAGEVSQIVRLTVLVEPQGTGSLVTIDGSVLPGRAVSGDFDEVTRYAALLQEGK